MTLKKGICSLQNEVRERQLFEFENRLRPRFFLTSQTYCPVATEIGKGMERQNMNDSVPILNQSLCLSSQLYAYCQNYIIFFQPIILRKSAGILHL